MYNFRIVLLQDWSLSAKTRYPLYNVAAVAVTAAVAAVAASCADDSILTLLSLAAKQFHLNEKIGTFCENRFWLIFNLFSFLLRNAAVVEKKIKT